MDSSKFNLWRISFAFCHIDFTICGEEKKWMEEKLKIIKLSPDQEAILRQDMDVAADIMSLVPLVTKPADRSFLVHQLHLLAHLDGVFSEKEKAKLEIIKKHVLSFIDLKQKEQIAADMGIIFEKEFKDQIFNKKSLFEKFFKMIF